MLETLTVLATDGPGATTVELPSRCEENDPDCDTATLIVDAPESDELAVAYAVSVPQWQPAYRVVLGEDEARLQVWALVHNASEEAWTEVDLRLATAAPFSFESNISRPRRQARPDASGHFRASPTLGVVTGSRTRRLADGDDDLCPDEPEDYDGFEDEDGCPDLDNDHDNIADVDDACPSEAENYNGMEDTDGCPDRARVVVQSSQIQILERLFFEEGSSAVQAASAPILDAIAATLQANPDVRRVRIEGHASNQEQGTWALSAERAATVRSALIERGVEVERLMTVAFGDSRPVGSPERDRRAEFRVDERGTVAEDRDAVTPATLALNTQIESASGAVVYHAPARVSVRAGATALIAVLDRSLRGGDVLLYRPDAAVAGSDRHPFRAARLVAPDDIRLVPGPVAVFARDRFAGEGIVGSLEPGERAFIPYRLDTGVHVQVEQHQTDEPRNIVALERGILTVASMNVHATRYTIEAGTDPAGRVHVRHMRRAGHRVRGELPPGTERSPGALVIPLPLSANETSVLRVEEQRVVQRNVDLLGDLRTVVDVFDGTNLPPQQRETLGRAIRLRVQLRENEDARSELRRQLTDAAQRSAELRRNLNSLEQRGDEAVRRTLRVRLREAVSRTEGIARSIDEAGVQRIDRRTELVGLLASLRIAPLAESPVERR